MRKLIEHACLAGSAHNHQPWRFVKDGNAIEARLDRARLLPHLDPSSHQAYIGLGAAVENLLITAREEQLHPELEVIAREDRVARVRLAAGSPPTEEETRLSRAIPERLTNRKGYLPQAIPAFCLDKWKRLASEYGASLSVVREKDRMAELSRVIGLSEKIGFEHPGIATETFDWFRSSTREYEEKRDGLWSKTMELGPLEPFAKPLLRRLNTFNKLGASKVLAKKSEMLAKQSDALITLTVPGYSHREFFQGGRAFQRIALEAHLDGVSIHPINFTMILFVLLHEHPERLNERHRKEAKRLQEAFYRIAGIGPEEGAVLLFRAGYAPGAPKYLSHRRPVQLEEAADTAAG